MATEKSTPKEEDLTRGPATGDPKDSRTASQPEASHTPAPWAAVQGSVNSPNIHGAWGDVEETSPDGFSIATIWADVEELVPAAAANARLIAAAPLLLAAARRAADAIGTTRDEFGLKPELEKAYLALHVAIDKAEGRQS